MRKFCNEFSLGFLEPDLSKEWDYDKNYPLTPFMVFRLSNKKAWWKCNNGHIYLSKISTRSNGSGCSYCYGDKADKNTCLYAVNPSLSKECDYDKNGNVKPENVLPNSHKNMWWKCKKGHSYRAIIQNRIRGDGCPYCSGHKVCKDNCLSVLNIKLSKEWDIIRNGNLKPENVSLGSKKEIYWNCSKGHIWKAAIKTRVYGHGCPYCNKIELKDGSLCDSASEAYYYLKLKETNVDFFQHVEIGLGKSTCDFYIPILNKYIEITGYNKRWLKWRAYLKRIARKKAHIVNKLNSDFEFVQLELLPKQIQFVRENSL